MRFIPEDFWPEIPLQDDDQTPDYAAMALEADAERYRWLAEHPNEWRLYRKHGKHKLPFRMMKYGDPWGQSFATADEAIDAARSKA